MAKNLICLFLLLWTCDFAHAEMDMVHYGYCRTFNGQPDPKGTLELPCAIFIDTEIPNKFFVSLLDGEVIVVIYEVDNQTLSKRVVYSRPSI